MIITKILPILTLMKILITRTVIAIRMMIMNLFKKIYIDNNNSNYRNNNNNNI